MQEMAGQIEYEELSEFYLDPRNPRLGLSDNVTQLPQEEIYQRMRDWSLEELAISFLESGFWAHEAVLCTTEEIDGEDRLVVIEGNRRIAALKRLRNTYAGEESSKRWLELVDGIEKPEDLFSNVPYIRIGSRSEIDAFLGFRHVTGIKDWAPPEKARFIAKLIDEGQLGYRDVMRKIGSTTPVVERNYIAFSILTQMESVEGLSVEEVKNRFSVLFLSLRSRAVQRFLGVEDKFGVDPKEVNPPVKADKLEQLKEYSRWLFGDGETPPVVRDSREVDRFATVLASDEGLQYLRAVRTPSLEKAYVIAGGDQEEIYELVSTAAYNLQEALSSIHLYKDDERLIAVSRRLVANAEQIRRTLGIEPQ
ncbi:MAG: hypothetical protein OXH79_18720 [Boseongicola sp.]|nr:hypothetical protein [Boseongicola sp.]